MYISNKNSNPVLFSLVLTVSLIAFYLLISLSLKAVCQPYSEPSALCAAKD